MHHVARLGGDWYCKADSTNLFKVPKPNIHTGIGIDALPESIRHSPVLSGNHLGQLGNIHTLPVVQLSFNDDKLKQLIQYYNLDTHELETEVHKYAAQLLNEGKTDDAWQVLLATEVL